MLDKALGNPNAAIRALPSGFKAALVAVTAMLVIFIIALISCRSISHPAASPAPSSLREAISSSFEGHEQSVTEADRHFDERARATEAGFKAAFPLGR